MIIDFAPPPSSLKLSIRFSKLAFVAFCQAAPTRRHFVEKKQMKFREKKNKTDQKYPVYYQSTYYINGFVRRSLEQKIPSIRQLLNYWNPEGLNEYGSKMTNSLIRL